MIGATVLAGLFAVYAVFASRLDRMWITAPMVFVFAGALFGRYGLDWVHEPLSGEPVRSVTELTLALLLFADASTISLHEVEVDGGVPTRLLLLGLPLTMVLGTLVGMALFPSAGWAAMALIAVILAPTDAALGLAVVTNPVVPVRVRRVLNVESGLNDGIATPFVTWLLALVVADESAGHSSWALHAFEEIGLAILAAVAVGIGGGRLIAWTRRRGWTSATSEQLAVLALAFLSYEGALAIGGNGFVAAFASGILFGATTRHTFHEATEFTETLAMFSSFL
ncbi:MAG TPA: cation:proton antiporter, partial [Actinomycetota bacterium]|nr:cation:proton antiporter [Actinomycetota bacterium]